MRRWVVAAAAVGAAVLGWGLWASPSSRAEDAKPSGGKCLACHTARHPGIVKDWKESAHAKAPEPVGCDACHGTEHGKKDDHDKAKMPTAKVCAGCHKDQAEQFGRGKHALGEASVKAIPMLAAQPESVRKMACEGCHSVGKVWEDGSVGRCDSCHTRHLFSKEEASKPEACETCHMGEDHSQYEMWRSAKHGVIHHLQEGSGRAPVCQTCHFQKGDHAVMTGWGFLGLRLPVPDEQWTKDTMTIVQAVGPWGRDEEGMKARVGAIEALKLARLDQASFDAERGKMLDACKKCHSSVFAKGHLENADQVIRETTHLMAEAVRVVEALYADGILPMDPAGPKHPDLLLFYDSPTEIEQELYRMFLFHRQKAFQGAIHANPDYMHWYGWAPMKSSFQRIQALAAEMRAKAAAK